MEERRKTLVAAAIILGFLVFVVIVTVLVISGKKIVSPVPEESGIKIILITPTPSVAAPSPRMSTTP